MIHQGKNVIKSGILPFEEVKTVCDIETREEVYFKTGIIINCMHNEFNDSLIVSEKIYNILLEISVKL